VTLRRLAGALLLPMLLASTPAPARAEIWAGLSGGVSLPQGTSPYGTLQVRPSAAIAVGWDSEFVGASLWAALVTTQAGILLSETCYPVMVRVRGRLPLGLAVPFVFGGVGFAPSRGSLDMVVDNTVAFTAQAGAGLDLVFGDRFTLGAEGGWLWLSPTHAFGTVNLNGVLLLATLALRFG